MRSASSDEFCDNFFEKMTIFNIIKTSEKAMPFVLIIRIAFQILKKHLFKK